MIRSFRSRASKRFWTRQDTSGLKPDWAPKIKRLLDGLENADAPEKPSIVGFGFHRLRGDMAGRFAVTVSRNWRLTFAWEGEDAIDVDLEDYHG